MLAALFFFLLYRKANLALEQVSLAKTDIDVDTVVALLAELEDTGAAIIERLENKQAELEQLVELLDAKMLDIQMALESQSAYDVAHKLADQASTQGSGSDPRLDQQIAAGVPDSLAPTAETELAPKHALVLQKQTEGLSAVEIAQQTGLKLDEIRLILNLLQVQSKT